MGDYGGDHLLFHAMPHRCQNIPWRMHRFSMEILGIPVEIHRHAQAYTDIHRNVTGMSQACHRNIQENTGKHRSTLDYTSMPLLTLPGGCHGLPVMCLEKRTVRFYAVSKRCRRIHPTEGFKLPLLLSHPLAFVVVELR
jgi:hypothetical protein